MPGDVFMPLRRHFDAAAATFFTPIFAADTIRYVTTPADFAAAFLRHYFDAAD